ncbi:B-cadherin-like [Xyrauchen texanus]|uniref:B-cadherin-like n=1 Tax=Xyrauchen texanus TaxID=154827 RepID=UPI0022422F24|nr:B-cadherin-like [Xyrauchen texanus]
MIFTCVFSLVVFTIQGEIIPEYASVIEERTTLFMHDKRNGVPLWQNATTSELHDVRMEAASGGMIRRKRDWMIPPISIPENNKGPFPKELVKMKSTAAKSMKMIYKITGAGADLPPRGLFIVNKYSGMLSVTKELDREETQQYVLTTHASAEGQDYIETPINIIIKVIDQNDNRPVCTQNPFTGNVLERAKQNVPVTQVTADDLDDPETENSIIRYKLVRQEPIGGVFHIDPVSGVISLASFGTLDRETNPVHTLAVKAADMDGQGLSSTCTVVIHVTDSNDHAPSFSQKTYASTVQENKAGEIVARLPVTDRDEPLSVNAVTKFTIIKGNEEGFFNISTGPNKMEGIITTTKGLDFEKVRSFSLVLMVENEVPFAVPLSTSTATVTISVLDVNESPIFEHAGKQVSVFEDLPVGSNITKYTAKDPDTEREQRIRYMLQKDVAKWLDITEDTGHVTVRSSLDRESSFVKDGQYMVLIVAYDNDNEPTTGTATLVIELMDVNDNAPVLEQRRLQMCSTEPKPVRLTITDADGPEYGAPFSVDLHKEYHINWTVTSNSSSSAVWFLSPRRYLAAGEYQLLLRVYDSQMLFQDSSLVVEVCDCKGDDVTCVSGIQAASISTLFSFVLAAIFCLLVLLLLLLLLRRKCAGKREHFIHQEQDRGNILCYNEEGGEEDQDYDMSLLQRRPEVFCTDIAPMALPPVFYRLHREENEDIVNFIDDNLCTADDEHFVAPYDSVLVFGYEGEGSDAGSLSSLQSSSSDGDQDYKQLQHWGPPFKRLADMYAGEED